MIKDKKTTLRVILNILLLASGLAWIWISRASGSPETYNTSPARGFKAPPLALENSQGELVALEDLRGQAVIVNFWASWCPPCRAEMPALQKLQDVYQGADLVILAVNATNQDDRKVADEFAAAMNLTFPILYDPSGTAGSSYQVQSLPTTFFIDRDGIIRDVIIGGPMAEALLKIRASQLIQGELP